MDQGTWNQKAKQSPQDEQEEPVEQDRRMVESQICVLLVEDESLIAEIIAEALEEHGFSVHSVSNASEALAHLSAGSRVDVLFTDINLPGELDGAALAERARDMLPDLPVIYASGRWGRLDELCNLPLSITLQKPYSPARACTAVEVLMSQRMAGAEGPYASRRVLAS